MRKFSVINDTFCNIEVMCFYEYQACPTSVLKKVNSNHVFYNAIEITNIDTSCYFYQTTRSSLAHYFI